ncbi:hypothetical protein METESE_22030 [Mesoterricola sediminis]|uniref:Sel1 repeat family protein n=2 Tax=Mesoterricola sediminis TaxID=2927980 RepID=A0AA48GX33_9BACT|nr:hypothetical protein METESE_22030 [Mesoterricola sediminis]
MLICPRRLLHVDLASIAMGLFCERSKMFRSGLMFLMISSISCSWGNGMVKDSGETHKMLKNSFGAASAMSAALSGDVSAARILCSGDNEYWVEIAAENGDQIETHNMGVLLSNGPEIKQLARSLFWFYRAKDLGLIIYPNNIPRLENKLELALGTGYAKRFNYHKDMPLADLEVSAMLGDAESARALFELNKSDKALKYRWARIGAQNGSLECMFEYGLLLQDKHFEPDILRGTYWIRRSAVKHYQKACEFLNASSDISEGMVNFKR